MNPIIAIPIIALIITSLGITVVTITNQQSMSAETTMQISNAQNERIREDLEFTLDVDGNIMVENKWSDDTKILEVRVLDDDGKVIKSWIADQHITVGKTSKLALNDSILSYLDTLKITP